MDGIEAAHLLAVTPQRERRRITGFRGFSRIGSMPDWAAGVACTEECTALPIRAGPSWFFP